MKTLLKLNHLYYVSIILGIIVLYVIQFHSISNIWLVCVAIVYLLGFIQQCKKGFITNDFTFNKLATSLFAAYAIGLVFFMLSFCFGFISTHLVDFFWGENKGKLIFLYFLFALPFVWKKLKVNSSGL